MRIGILGAGQLGRMLALAGYPLGHEFTLYDPAGKPSAGVGAIVSDPDRTRLAEFLAQVDTVTYEFEHLPLDLVDEIGRQRLLRPGPQALAAGQNREREKAMFSKLGIPTPQYRIVTGADQLQEAARELGCPVVAKSVTDGYDGKGQAVLRQPEEAQEAWQSIGHEKLVVEAFVDFKREVSVIAARSADGAVKVYPLAENIHADGILRYSISPAPALPPELQQNAEIYMEKLLAELDYVGVLALELFETREGLWANEIAPRVHNSGHWSIEGSVTSQFENHVRAVAGDPLGDVSPRGLSCMINIIGQHGDREAIMKLPYAHLHDYGKAEKPGRKIGHITVLADDYDTLYARVRECAALLPGCPVFEPYSG